MNEAHLHLLINHSPIVGSFIALCILLAAVLRGNATVLRVGLWVLVFSAVLGFAALQTGEGAEEIVEHLPGVSHKKIHEHEEASEFANWILLAAGALGAFTLWKSLRDSTFPRMLALVTLVVTLAGFGTMARAGLLGGEIMHPETQQEAIEAAAEHEKHEEHHEQGEHHEEAH